MTFFKTLLTERTSEEVFDLTILYGLRQTQRWSLFDRKKQQQIPPALAAKKRDKRGEKNNGQENQHQSFRDSIRKLVSLTKKFI